MNTTQHRPTTANPAPKMKVGIFQRGGVKNHAILEEAARFYAGQLMTNRMANTLEIRIEVRATTLPKNWAGSAWTKANGSQASKRFIIQLLRDRPLAAQPYRAPLRQVHLDDRRLGGPTGFPRNTYKGRER